ncbi:amidase [Brevibacterium litoralis]|uniref:amidase n=1 Tax=Brevibacterium litoralis TaxID=3138935 RepID=UPI0032F091CE
MSLMDLSLLELAAKIEATEISPVELTQASLDRIHETEPVVSAFAAVTADAALAEARVAESDILAGNHRGPLHGIPFGVKDLYDVAGVPTTASSEQRTRYVPDADSAAVARLRAAGMIVVGKTETHEFAYGAMTPRSSNPWDTDRIPGGSSGGSGAAIGAGAVHVGLGSDTAGSIRIPAAVCGTVGLKPTFGRASRAGVASLSWSLDHVGPLTRNVMDAALVMDAMSGFDPRDPGSVPAPEGDIADQTGTAMAGIRVGVPENFFTDHVEPGVWENYRASLGLLADLGAELVPVTVPYADEIVRTNGVIVAAEAASYHRTMLRENPGGYTDDLRTKLEIGSLVRAVDYIDALRMRTLVRSAWAEMARTVDVIVAPSVAAVAVRKDAPSTTYPDGTTESESSIYTRLSAPANQVGVPALSVPNGFSEGLPTGVQIIGAPFAERQIVSVGLALEANSPHVGLTAPIAPVSTSVSAPDAPTEAVPA